MLFNRFFGAQTRRGVRSICFGGLYKCKVTGFQGTAIGKASHLNGCERITLEHNKEGKTTSYEIDEVQLDLVSSIFDVISMGYPSEGPAKFKLGETVRDSISGFKGIVVIIKRNIGNTISYYVQPRVSEASIEIPSGRLFPDVRLVSEQGEEIVKIQQGHVRGNQLTRVPNESDF